VENDTVCFPHVVFVDLTIRDELFPTISDRVITLFDAFRNITDVVALMVGLIPFIL
jgi:hypothetical protein